MTKEEMIKQMTTEELASFLREISDNKLIQYADVEEWLLDNSGSPITSYCGKPGKYSTQSEFLKASGGIPEIPASVGTVPLESSGTAGRPGGGGGGDRHHRPGQRQHP